MTPLLKTDANLLLKVFAMPNYKVLVTTKENFNLGLKVTVYPFYYALHKIGKYVTDFLFHKLLNYSSINCILVKIES